MLKPINDHIVLQIIEQENKTQGGIILPTAATEKPYHGRVVACNAEYRMPDGSVKATEVAVGDIVMFGKTHGTEVVHNNEKYLVIAEEFILCKIED